MFGLLRGRFLTYNLIKFCHCVFIFVSRIALNTGRSTVKHHFNFVFNFVEDASKRAKAMIHYPSGAGL